MGVANKFQLSGHGTEIIYSTRSPDILASFSTRTPVSTSKSSATTRLRQKTANWAHW